MPSILTALSTFAKNFQEDLGEFEVRTSGNQVLRVNPVSGQVDVLFEGQPTIRSQMREVEGRKATTRFDR